MEGIVKNQSKSIFKNKNFMLLLIGQIVSNVGNALHSIAVSWYLLTIVGKENSGLYLAGFMMCMLIPYIVFGPISGVFVDKLNRKKIIAGTDIIRGILLLILAVLTIYKIYPIFSLFAITALSSFFATFFNPAVDSSLPNIVSEDNLMKANSFNGMSRQLTLILGSAVAGFLYMFTGIIGIFIINGISFILSGISESFINLPHTKKKEETKTSFSKDFIDGIKYLKGHKVIVILLGFSLFLNFLFNPLFSIVFPKVIKFTLGLKAGEFGLFEAILGVGALVGMIIVSMLPKMKKYHKLMLAGICIQSVGVILFGIPVIPSIQSHLSSYTIFIIYCVLIFIMMLFNSIINVPIFTIFQQKVSDEYRGRFFGMLGTLSQGIVPLGLLVVGYLSDIVLPSTLFIAAGVISIILAIAMGFVKEFREL